MIEHELRHEIAASELAQLPFQGVFNQSNHPTKNVLEKKLVDSIRDELGEPGA